MADEPIIPYPEFDENSFKPMKVAFLSNGVRLFYPTTEHAKVQQDYADKKKLIVLGACEVNEAHIIAFADARWQDEILEQTPMHMKGQVQVRWQEYQNKLGLIPNRESLVDMALDVIKSFAPKPVPEEGGEGAPAENEQQGENPMEAETPDKK